MACTVIHCACHKLFIYYNIYQISKYDDEQPKTEAYKLFKSHTTQYTIESFPFQFYSVIVHFDRLMVEDWSLAEAE